MSQVLWYPGHELLLKDIVRAENCYLYDSFGKRYVDLEAGVWCTSVGHGNPNLLRIMAEQAAKVAHTGFNYSCELLDNVAKAILFLLGFQDGKCVFLCAGSEAIEYGVRVAQFVSEKPMMMTMADSYFGAYGSARERKEHEWFDFDWFPCLECPESKSCDKDCKHWLSIPFDKIGGFLFEPGSSSGLVRFPPAKLIQNIDRTIKEGDGLILINEVTTGVGRTGKWFGFQHYDISPDIVGIGKGIGNGYPVSVTAFAPGVMDLLGDKPVNYAQSHQNDPLGAAVVMEVIRVIKEEKLIERGREIAELLVGGLKKIHERCDLILEIRSRGLMVAVELRDDSKASLAIRVQKELISRGFVLARRPGLSVLRLDPALTIEREDIEEFLDTFEEILRDEH
ncbi:MAG: aspartate aminotransferase family protein [Candidatus Eisenbacteria bacterium]|uniref:Aspartate aminotransferase family protein n=1 Tax=Eiseniibacteriota bacterium TaxID=2212470 RepID=A0A948S231_UNCEI|nr:aspartate aminotransferase family protein [Candidatus Eisenbacteria bacterium]MBU1948807.1 aspartate aminotransferase family protein [Candidatus Eisenbacteria bacterium]MBU2692434.1 aspartate aminotransferase family protein [Candidatus Eisenbacteria bacterium]